MFNKTDCPEHARQHRVRMWVCPWRWRLSSAQVSPVNIFLTFRKFREVFSISLPTLQPLCEEGRRCQDSLPCPRVDSWSWFELGKQNTAAGVGLGCCPLPSAIAA